MNKKVIASALVIMSLCTTSVYADYVDNSNREHADQSNLIVNSAFIPKRNNVVIYLDNETGIDYDLGTDLDNFSIPFVKIRSIKAEKRKLSDDGKSEVDSEYYNKITLVASSSIHDKQRFILIKDFKNGIGSETSENLLHSIAPRGEMDALEYSGPSSEVISENDNTVKITKLTKVEAVEAISNTGISYDHIKSCVATDPEHIRLDFADGIELDKTDAEDHLSYQLTSESGKRLYALKAVMLSSNQVILETQTQTSNERYSIKADWINEGEKTAGLFFSNSVSNTLSESTENLNRVNEEITFTIMYIDREHLKLTTESDLTEYKELICAPENYIISGMDPSSGKSVVYDEIVNIELSDANTIIIQTQPQEIKMTKKIKLDWLESRYTKTYSAILN